MANNHQQSASQQFGPPVVGSVGHPPNYGSSVSVQFRPGVPMQPGQQFVPTSSSQFHPVGQNMPSNYGIPAVQSQNYQYRQQMQQLPPMHSLPGHLPSSQAMPMPYGGPPGRPLSSGGASSQQITPPYGNQMPSVAGPGMTMPSTYTFQHSSQVQTPSIPAGGQPWLATTNQPPATAPAQQPAEQFSVSAVTTAVPMATDVNQQSSASDWQEHTSADGRRYYYNKKTRQSSWEKPLDLMTPIERADASTGWKEFTTPEGNKYYYNKVTKQSKWTIPEDLKAPTATNMNKKSSASDWQERTSADGRRSSLDPVLRKRRRIVLKQTTSSAFYPLGDDLCFEILKRLLLKDMLRCRCVCRSWHSLIASPTFIKNHLDAQLHKLEDGGNRDLVLLRDIGGPPEQRQAIFSLLDFKNLSDVSQQDFHCPITPVNNAYFKVVGSVHGLICLLDNNMYNPTKDVILVWNPSVYRYIRLPLPPSNHTPNSCGKYHYMSFPRFTFNPIKNDYLVVRLKYCFKNIDDKKAESPSVVEFYSLGNDEWKTAGNAFLLEPYIVLEELYSQYRSSIDGSVCWIAWNKGGSMVVLFSAVEYKLKSLPFPEQLGHLLCPIRSSVIEYRGLLSVMKISSTHPMGVELAFEIWSWIDKEDQWCQMVSINTAVDGLRFRDKCFLRCIHRVTDDDCVLGSRAGQGENAQLILFHSKTNQIDKLRDHTYGSWGHYMGSCMQSLLLLNKESGALSYDPTTIPRSYQRPGDRCHFVELKAIYKLQRGFYEECWNGYRYVLR